MNIVASHQILDYSNNKSNNDGEDDGDFKRVNEEVLESSKTCVFQPNLFL